MNDNDLELVKILLRMKISKSLKRGSFGVPLMAVTECLNKIKERQEFLSKNEEEFSQMKTEILQKRKDWLNKGKKETDEDVIPKSAWEDKWDQ